MSKPLRSIHWISPIQTENSSEFGCVGIEFDAQYSFRTDSRKRALKSECFAFDHDLPLERLELVQGEIEKIS